MVPQHLGQDLAFKPVIPKYGNVLLSLSVTKLLKTSYFAAQIIRIDSGVFLLFSFYFLEKLRAIDLTLEEVTGVALTYLVTVNCSNLLSRLQAKCTDSCGLPSIKVSLGPILLSLDLIPGSFAPV